MINASLRTIVSKVCANLASGKTKVWARIVAVTGEAVAPLSASRRKEELPSYLCCAVPHQGSLSLRVVACAQMYRSARGLGAW